MDLYSELIKVLKKAKASDEYFNPHFLTAVLEAMEAYHPAQVDEKTSEELWDWINDESSR